MEKGSTVRDTPRPGGYNAFPDDADGDALRRLGENGFDFSRKILIDFNVDFEAWPPSNKAVAILASEYPSTRVYEPDGADEGYVHFQVYAQVTYDLVTMVQRHVTKLMMPFRGECNSWGVMT
jgi:hypothetical protein